MNFPEVTIIGSFKLPTDSPVSMMRMFEIAKMSGVHRRNFHGAIMVTRSGWAIDVTGIRAFAGPNEDAYASLLRVCADIFDVVLVVSSTRSSNLGHMTGSVAVAHRDFSSLASVWSGDRWVDAEPGALVSLWNLEGDQEIEAARELGPEAATMLMSMDSPGEPKPVDAEQLFREGRLFS